MEVRICTRYLDALMTQTERLRTFTLSIELDSNDLKPERRVAFEKKSSGSFSFEYDDEDRNT
jgi:hypothetical protein